jgi:hypothetical protein
MMLKCAAAAALGLALLASPAPSQTVAEQMQKAIYAQQTAGDLDTAIQIYRQILTSSGADRKTAAAAQFRLAQSLLQKGELAEAAREFQMLANYPEYTDAIAKLAGRVSRAHQTVVSRGDYSAYGNRGGVYNNIASGVQIRVPPGWTLVDGDSDDNGKFAQLTDPETEYSVVVWMRSEQHAAADIPALLQHDLENKPSQRGPGWMVRPESVQHGGSGDQQWLRGIADWTVNGQPWVEYVAWIRTPKTHVFVFANVPASNRGFQSEYLRILNEDLVVP